MSHYAKIDENNIVIKVLRIDEEAINTGRFGDPSSWIQTSYNTNHGEHCLGGTPLRKNYAGKGFTYDQTRDAFIPQQPFPSWILNEDTCHWDAPIPYPLPEHVRRTAKDAISNHVFEWDEDNVTWKRSPVTSSK